MRFSSRCGKLSNLPSLSIFGKNDKITTFKCIYDRTLNGGCPGDTGGGRKHCV
uniref:Uncharacterized protein n=1 Tax=Anguilla anguilla TaxID=7936 RepID=A0A0E9RB75_ANGAN